MYFTNDILSGWDGAYHYATNKYYSDHIFPDIFGWTNNWYAGMPWPVGYPPLFAYVMAILVRILPFSYVEIFRYMFFLLTLIFPILVYAITIKLKFSKINSLTAGIITIFYLISGGDFAGILGICMGGTFENGLYPQFFSSIILLIWIYIFIDFDKSIIKKILSAIFFTLIILSNVHIAETAFVIIVVKILILFFKKEYTSILIHILFIIISFGISAFWVFPLVETREYFLTRSIGNVPLKVGIMSIFIPLILGSIGGIFNFKKKNYIAYIFFSAILIFLVSVLPIYKFFPSLPLQPFRLLPVAYLFFVILSPLGIEKFANLIKDNNFFKYGIYLFSIIPFFFFFPEVHKIIGGIYDLKTEDRQLIEFLKTKTDGRSIVEVTEDLIPTEYLPKNTQPTHFVITAYLGDNSNHQSLWSVFRESSINSPFVQPVRNSFSYQHESYGVVCWLCTDAKNKGGYRSDEFYGQTTEEKIERAYFMGVKYIAVNSDQQVYKLNDVSEDLLKLIWQSGRWYVFEIQNEVNYVEVLENEPIYVYTNLNNGEREADSYDWLRLNEEILFWNDYENILVFNKESIIDKDNYLEKFKIVLISDYKYVNLEKAKEKIINFSNLNTVILLEQKGNKLFDELSVSQNENIFIIERTGDVRNDLKKIIDIAKLKNKVSENDKSINVKNYSNENIKIKIENEGQNFILIKNTYYPYWKSDEAELFMASPSYTLAVAEESFEMKFEKSTFSKAGMVLSIIALTILIFVYISAKYRLHRLIKLVKLYKRINRKI